MMFRKLSDIKQETNWFGLPKEKRISITELYNKEIIFFDYLQIVIKNEDKIIVKFAYVDNPDDFYCFITKSIVIKDRLSKDKEVMPFIAQIKKIKNYVAYE